MLSKPFRDPLRRCTRSLPSLPSLSFHPTVLTQDDPVLCYEAPSRPVGCFPSFRYCGLWFAFLLLSRPRVSVTIDASMSTLYFSGRQYVIRRLNPTTQISVQRCWTTWRQLPCPASFSSLAPTFFHTKTRAMTLALTAEPHRAFYTLITLLLSHPRESRLPRP